MNVKSVAELQNILMRCEAREAANTKELEILSNQIGGLELFDPQKKSLKTKIKTLKEELRALRYWKKQCYNLLSSYTTFPSKLFLPFLVKYLATMENEEYTQMGKVQKRDYLTAIATKTFPLNTFGTEYDIITTIQNQPKLSRQRTSGYIPGDTDNIRAFLSICEDKKYVCLESLICHTLLNGTRLHSDFANYPYLRDLGFQLVDQKLSDPSISDDARLNFALENAIPQNKDDDDLTTMKKIF